MVPDTISEAEAERRSTNTANLMPVSKGSPKVLYALFHSVTLPLVVTTNSPRGTKLLTTEMASRNSPPGLPLKSRTKARISGLVFFSSANAFRTSNPALGVNPASLINPVVEFNMPE